MSNATKKLFTVTAKGLKVGSMSKPATTRGAVARALMHLPSKSDRRKARRALREKGLSHLAGAMTLPLDEVALKAVATRVRWMRLIADIYAGRAIGSLVYTAEEEAEFCRDSCLRSIILLAEEHGYTFNEVVDRAMELEVQPA